MQIFVHISVKMETGDCPLLHINAMRATSFKSALNVEYGVLNYTYTKPKHEKRLSYVAKYGKKIKNLRCRQIKVQFSNFLFKHPNI